MQTFSPEALAVFGGILYNYYEVFWLFSMRQGETMHRRRKLPENGVVIVLGGRVVGASKTCPAHLSRAFQYRVDTAASYLKAYPKAVCITTRGQG